MLEEAVELVEVAVGDGQERGGIGLVGLGDLANLELELVAEALDPSDHLHEVAALEAAGQQIGVAEGAGLDRARVVAQLDGQVRRARPRHQAVLPGAGEDVGDLVARL